MKELKVYDKIKDIRNGQIYLLDYFTVRIAKSFDLVKDKEVLSFLDIVIPENKTAFQEYTKYLFRITAQSVSTIKIQHAYTREFLHFWKKKLWLYRI